VLIPDASSEVGRYSVKAKNGVTQGLNRTKSAIAQAGQLSVFVSPLRDYEGLSAIAKRLFACYRSYRIGDKAANKATLPRFYKPRTTDRGLQTTSNKQLVKTVAQLTGWVADMALLLSIL
jgi:hypothetical protein